MEMFWLLIWYGVFVISVLAVGRFWMKWWHLPTQSWLATTLLAWAIGCVHYAYLFMLLGAVGMLHAGGLIALYLIPVYWTVIEFSIRYWRRPAKLIALVRQSAQWIAQPAQVVTCLILMAVFFPLIPYLFLYPVSWDGVAYHMLLPKFYLAQHALPFVSWFPQTAFPMGIHALFGYAEALHETRLYNFITFSFVVTTTLTIISLPSTYLSRPAKAVALFFFLFQPMLYNEVSYSPYIDYPMAFFSMMTAVVAWQFTRRPTPGRAGVLLLLTGFMPLIKLTGAFMVIGVGVWLFIKWWRETAFKKWTTGLLSQPLLLISLAATMLPTMYWFGRNWVMTHNPLYPFFNGVFKGFGYDPQATDIMADDIQLLNNYLKPMTLRFLASGDSVHDLVKLSEFGLAIFLVIGGVLALWRGTTFQRHFAGLGLSVLVPTMWLVGPLFRYYVLAVPVLTVAIAPGLVQWLTTPSPRFGKLLLKIIGGAMLSMLVIIQLDATLAYRDALYTQLPKRSWLYFMDADTARQKLFVQDNHYVTNFANQNLNRQTDKILQVFDNRLYYLQVPAQNDESNLSGYFVSPGFADATAVRNQLQADGFTHLIINRNWGMPPNIRVTVFNELVSQYLDPIYTEKNVTLYQLK